MSGMFAVVVSGRLVQTDFQQVDVNKFLITIPNVDTINHLVVFMTGTQPLQPDMGASVHFSWPNSNTQFTVWKFLGMISNDKPSAIFKLSDFKDQISSIQCSGFYANQQANANLGQIGISIEPLIALNAQMAELKNQGNNQLAIVGQVDKKLDPNSLMLFVTKTAESLFNHVASFATTIPAAGINEQIVPVSAIEGWYNSFKRKLEFNPNFWINSS